MHQEKTLIKNNTSSLTLALKQLLEVGYGSMLFENYVSIVGEA